MSNRNRMLLISIIIIALGTGLLLNSLHIVVSVDWVWTLLLAAGGLFTLWLGGVNKLTFVVGVFLITTSIGSYLRQTGRISTDVEVPALVLVLGLLMLIATLAPLPTPKWLGDEAHPPSR